MLRAACLILLPLLVACGGDESRDAPYGGIIQVTQVDVGGTTSVALGGYFAEVPLSSIEMADIAGCTTVDRAGSCLRISCTGTGVAPSQNAGVLTLRDGGAVIVEADYASMAYGAGADTRLSPGGSVELAASGALVPAFAATVTVPESVRPTLPTSISRSAPLTVAWPAEVAAERTTLSLTASRPGGGSDLVSCTVPSAEGQVTVATSLLEGFESGSMVFVGASTTNAVRLVTGDYSVEARANWVAASQTTTFD